MKLKDVMTREVEVISPDANLNEIAQLMKSEDTGALPVCDGRKIRGMVTDRDLVIRALAEGRHPEETHASDIMTREVFYCFDDQDVEEASDLMRKKQVRRVVVLDRNKNLVGVASIGDLALQSGKKDLAGKTLRDVSSPDSPQSYYKQLSKIPRRPGFGLFLGSLAVVGIGAGTYLLLRGREFEDVLDSFKDSFEDVKEYVLKFRKKVA